jgi:hypothetical protein
MTALQNFVGTPSELTGPDHAGKTINRPPDRQTGATFKRAPKAKGKIERPSGFLDD